MGLVGCLLATLEDWTGNYLQEESKEGEGGGK